MTTEYEQFDIEHDPGELSEDDFTEFYSEEFWEDCKRCGGFGYNEDSDIAYQRSWDSFRDMIRDMERQLGR